MPLLICAVLGFLVSSTCISTPSVSLEGKSIWILKSLPLAPRQILLAKLRFHNVLVVPHSLASGSDFVPGLRLWAGDTLPDGISWPSGPAVASWAWSAASSGPVWIG